MVDVTGGIEGLRAVDDALGRGTTRLSRCWQWGLDSKHTVDSQSLGSHRQSYSADGSHRAWVSCTEGLTSVDRVSLDTNFSVEEITFQVRVFVPRRAASDLEASNIFSIANRADRVEETQQEILDRLRSRFEDMQEMTAAVVSNLRNCVGAAPDDSGEASEGNGSVSFSDNSGDVNNTGVDTGEDSTASAGDGTAVDRTEADDAGNEEDAEGQEPDAHVIDANPPTLD
ncbi:unnamed protein product [Ectocarpus sp. CCAP 1310/34]|nr:unnamed protein product [Ectocarpus sp. CCAP 1310/34]